MCTKQLVSNFRERFSQLFEESEKSTTALGKDLHVSNQTISAWKTGARSPKEPTIIAVAKYFNVNPAWLVGFDVEREAPKKDRPIVIPDTERFSRAMQYMTPEDYDMVMSAFERAYKKMDERDRKERERSERYKNQVK